MQIVSNWSRILRYSLQFWTNIAAAVLGTLEVALQTEPFGGYIRDVIDVPDNVFLVGSIVTIFLSNIFRFITQDKVSGNGKD